MSKYLVKDFQEGLYECDTIFVKVDKEIYQIPCTKGIASNKLIGKEISIEKLDRVLEKIIN